MAVVTANLKDSQDRAFGMAFDDTAPNECPICHSSVSPKLHLRVVVQPGTPDQHIQSAYQCTNEKCNSLIVAVYKIQNVHPKFGKYYQISEVRPMTPVDHKFDDCVINLSPTFVKIFNQAHAAETLGLDQLSGIGMRKALEFLVKDFAIHNKPDEEEIIRASMLGKCIERYIEDHRIGECAKRAVWLGNDETHYTKKWEDKDIEDLKLLVDLTVHWIQYVLLTDRYMSEMPD